MRIPPPGAMEEGKVYCECCDRDAFPSYPWQGEGHLAIRFYDDGPSRSGVSCQPMLDGEKVPCCIELMAGRNGWVIQEFRPRVFCQTCGRPWELQYLVRFGEVTATLIEHKSAC